MHLRASSSLPPQPPPIPEQQEKLFEFLHTQKKIRALIDLTGNFGNQAATYNLIKRLRVLGFEGRIELIYFKSVKAKIMQLFDLNEHSEDSYYCANSAIEFIEFDLFLQKAQAGAIQPLALGLTGAMDSKPSQWASLIPNDNYADFLKVGAFVRFSPYYNMLDLCNTEIYLSGKKKPLIQEASCSKMLLTPSASFFEVQEYLVSNTKGKALAARYPALQTLLSYIDSGTINFQPLYGWTLRESPSNLLNIILGARFAQVQGGAAFRKPLVMGAFFNLRHNNFFLESLNLNISNLDLLKFTLENSWGCYDTYPGAAEVKKVSRDLNLKKALKIADLGDANTATQLQTLKADEIQLLTFPPLAKLPFDGLFSHSAANILAPVQEGASSANLLVTASGRPYIHCRSNYDWDLNLDFASPMLASHLTFFNSLICRAHLSDLNFDAWQYQPIHEWIGSYLLNAHNRSSELSRYFFQLQAEALKPENDRIAQDLERAREELEPEKSKPPIKDPALNPEKETAFSFTKMIARKAGSYLQKLTRNSFQAFNPFLPQSRAEPFDETKEQPLSSSSLIKKSLKICKKEEKSFFDRIVDSAICHAGDLANSCPSYFPQGYPSFWQTQGQTQTLLFTGRVNDPTLLNPLLQAPSPFFLR